MKILLDTNVLISALIFGGKAGQLLSMLFDSEHELYHKMAFHFCESSKSQMGELRDAKDIPVLSDALYHEVDMILTGDKDFLEADVEHRLMFSSTILWEHLTS